MMSSSSSEPKFVYGKDDALFGCIEEQQGDRPFGDFLDAGTGTHSMRWIATLHEKGLSSFTAITADAAMKRKVETEAQNLGLYDNHYRRNGGSINSSGSNHSIHSSLSGGSNVSVLMGNWFPKAPHESLRFDQQFDTILADYLIGAMDGFSPYKQDEMIPLLLNLLKPGGRLYIVGLEPIPDEVVGRENVVCKVRRVRDACILLAGHRCYREYPLAWIHKECQKQKERARLLDTRTFPILYRHNTIVRQINVARSKFPYFPTQDLVDSMKQVLDRLEQQSLHFTEDAPIKLGFDYVVAVEKLEE